MKSSELKGLSLDELKSKLEAEKDNYGKLKFAHSITPIENPMKIRESRRLVAKIQTEIRAKELSK
ncbi:50S ribosomal protein L29 [Marinoscillum furvescens]|uniref:Large ribosomal subunit protein uL29 n=1 Tax=Marinoscillum furvescens DSM 4134 TaxID=1122208 RepID=A0A3D9L489_MARFU|nr:50S ribosomal protein L29 [Marinoscillum furvescens]RED99488.1 large subunit ribosomal protein L29 [Marinoscillum furvescens DSM 4134]